MPTFSKLLDCLKVLGYQYVGSSIEKLEAAVKWSELEHSNVPRCFMRSFLKEDTSCRSCDLRHECEKRTILPGPDASIVEVKACDLCDGLMVIALYDLLGNVRDRGCTTAECHNTLKMATKRRRKVESLSSDPTGRTLAEIRDLYSMSVNEFAARIGVKPAAVRAAESSKKEPLSEPLGQALAQWLRTISESNA